MAQKDPKFGKKNFGGLRQPKDLSQQHLGKKKKRGKRTIPKQGKSAQAELLERGEWGKNFFI